MMTRTFVSALSAAMLLASCTGSGPDTSGRDSSGPDDATDTVVRVERDTVWLRDEPASGGSASGSGTTPRATPREPIIPGGRIAHVRIGGSLDSASRILGRADSGDAGAGHVMSFWFSRPGQAGKRSVLTVYASLDTGARFHQIRWVRVTSTRFATKEGLAVGTSLDSVRAAFPRARPTVEYDEGSRTYTIYDDVRSGIAFDMEKVPVGATSRAAAVTVHEPGRPLADSYLPMHDYRKLGTRAAR